MGKYIIFQAEPDAEGWETRKLQPSQSLTRILAEHLDYSNKPLPTPGYRPTQLTHTDLNSTQPSTHHHPSDWEVVRVETYTPNTPLGQYDQVVICYCQYNPINAPLQPLPPRQVSPDSFSGDPQAQQHWQNTHKQPAEV